MTPCQLLRTFLLLTVLLLPASASASWIYQFQGLTAALPPDPFHPDGVPAHIEAFTLTVPTRLQVPTTTPGDPTDFHFLQITEFDSCVSCSPLGVFLQINTPRNNGVQSAQIQFDDIANVAYAYLFLPGDFFALGMHTTAQWEAANHIDLGPFKSVGTLIVTQTVPAPHSLLLLGVGVVGLAFSRRRRVGERLT